MVGKEWLHRSDHPKSDCQLCFGGMERQYQHLSKAPKRILAILLRETETGRKRTNVLLACLAGKLGGNGVFGIPRRAAKVDFKGDPGCVFCGEGVEPLNHFSSFFC